MKNLQRADPLLPQIEASNAVETVSAATVASATALVSDEDFEDLLLAEELGRYFRGANGKQLVLSVELKALYPED